MQHDDLIQAALAESVENQQASITLHLNLMDLTHLLSVLQSSVRNPSIQDMDRHFAAQFINQCCDSLERCGLSNNAALHRAACHIPGTPTDATYTLSPGGCSITCHRCGRTSYNVGDIDNRYCGFCRKFHAEHTFPSKGASGEESVP